MQTRAEIGVRCASPAVIEELLKKEKPFMPGRLSSRASAIRKLELEDVSFWAVIARGCAVHMMNSPSFVEGVCLAPHPKHGYLCLPLGIPHASWISANHPEFDNEGLMGNWKFEQQADGRVLLRLIQAIDGNKLALFEEKVKAAEGPAWIKECYAYCFGGEGEE